VSAGTAWRWDRHLLALDEVSALALMVARARVVDFWCVVRARCREVQGKKASMGTCGIRCRQCQ
jgi:hypothetical protein